MALEAFYPGAGSAFPAFTAEPCPFFDPLAAFFTFVAEYTHDILLSRFILSYNKLKFNALQVIIRR